MELMRAAASVVMFVALLSGCVTTTALYGADLNPVAGSEDTYTLKVAYAGTNLTTNRIEKGTRKKLEQRAKEFLASRPEYVGYSVVDFERNLIPSWIVYTVKFDRAKSSATPPR